jgi:hypothetical protein
LPQGGVLVASLRNAGPMWAFLMRRDDTPLSRALQVVVVLAVGFLAARAFGLGTGAAVASAVGLACFDLLFVFARRRPPEDAPASRDAT